MNVNDRHNKTVVSCLSKLADFRGLHEAGTFVVCGCGASLNDLTHPERFITIGVNDIGRKFHPNYLVVVNPREQFTGDRFHYVESSQAKYIFTQLDLGIAHPHIIKFQLGTYAGTEFSDPETLPYTQNSPYIGLCLAVLMGARRIGLIGVDFTDHHFFAQSGSHQLTPQLATIDEQYRQLGEALRARGVEVYNLSRQSRLTGFPKMSVEEFTSLAQSKDTAHSSSADSSNATAAKLKIVSYATTPVAGVPAILARCINARTQHQARCVWAHNRYGNGVAFDGDIQWGESPAEAEAALAEADVVIVHNGKLAPQHEPLIAGKALITMAHNYAWNVDLSLVERGWPGVVIGQYQATLPEFSGWAVVPNPVPIWEPAFQPENKPTALTIAFTPSGRHERYPLDHQLYWHSKGYDTTLRELDRLAASFPLQLEVIRDWQVTHAEALAMKRRAHIVIDECVTGSYHRNSIEGLATGCVVVNGVGLLPGVPDAFRYCAGGVPDLPFVPARLEDLELVLTGLIARGTASLTAEGLRNNQWMQRHWDFERQWEYFWMPVINQAIRQSGRKLFVARAAPQALSTHSEISDEQPGPAMPDFDKTAMNRMDQIDNLVNGVSVVIPHGGEARLPLLTATLVNLRQCRGITEVIVVEMGEAPYAQETARRFADKYIFTRTEGQFGKARALNLGTPLASCKLLLWLDNDLIVPPHFVECAVAELQKSKLDCLIPWCSITYLGPQDSEHVRGGRRNPADCIPANVYYSLRGVHGAAMLVKKEFVMRYGGLHEEFRGWGGEDDAWLWKAKILGQVAITQYQDQVLYHLYHPLSGGNGGQEHIISNPHYHNNFKLLQEIRAISQREQFLRCYPPAPTFSCPWRNDQRILFFKEEKETALAHLAEEIKLTLLDWYGYGIETLNTSELCAHSDFSWLASADALVIFGASATRRFLDEPELAPMCAKMLVVIETTEGLTDAEIMRLGQAGAIVATGTAAELAIKKAGLNPWTINQNKGADETTHSFAAYLIQPLSIITSGTTAAGVTLPSDSLVPLPGDKTITLPVWMYWEGECPAWIRECQKTIFAHAADVRLLSSEQFDKLRDLDRDIDLSHLRVAQRADFIRAFLLSKYGGLWIDSDCLVMRSLQPVLNLLDRYDFVCHRERQGYISNGFIAAKAGSRVAAAYYQRICEVLRSGQPLGWLTLGSESLTEALRVADAPWYELECEMIQPICWSDQGAFFNIGKKTQHERTFNQRAICYMLANESLQRYLATHQAPDLLNEETFFSFLLSRALGRAETTVPGNLSTQISLSANGWRLLPFCLEAVTELAPQRVLELGPGLGRWGMLIREFCENVGGDRCLESWRTHLVGIALAPEQIAEQHGTLYNQMLITDGYDLFNNDERWDLVIFSEVLRVWPRDVIEMNLQRALDHSDYVLLNTLIGADPTPVSSHDSVYQSSWRLEDILTQSTVRYSVDEDCHDQSCGAFLLSLTDPKGLKRVSQLEQTFTSIFGKNLVQAGESVSGPGSCLAQTAEIRQRLPLLISDLRVRSLLDAPCGDFNWLSHVTLGLDQYIGVDIVSQLVAQNQQRYGGAGRQFLHLDVVAHPLPCVDLILCRDLLVHFNFNEIFKTLRNFKRSQSTYILMTQFSNRAVNNDIVTGDWRTLNFERHPFNFPSPLIQIIEKCTEAGGSYSDKSLALWRLADLFVS
jgi:hypothetical protein